MDIILMGFIGYVIGAVFRTSYDLLFKILEEPNVPLDRRYIVTMLISIILSFMSAAVTFSGIVLPPGSEMVVFVATLAQGFTVNHIINKPVTYLSSKKS